MKKYKRDERFDRGRGFKKGGSKDSGKPLMHQVICADCGKDCEVPFKPTSSKPVYCNTCFEKTQSDDPRRSGRERGARKFTGRDSRERGFGGRSSSRSTMHVIVCDKCGEDCEVPFRPTKGKPVYCDKCFEKSDHGREKSTDLLKKELDVINQKLDKILKALTPAVDTKKHAEEAEDPKPEKKTKKTTASKTAAKKPAPAKKTSASKTIVKKPVAAKKTTTAKTTVKKPASAKKTTKKK